MLGKSSETCANGAWEYSGIKCEAVGLSTNVKMPWEFYRKCYAVSRSEALFIPLEIPGAQYMDSRYDQGTGPARPGLERFGNEIPSQHLEGQSNPKTTPLQGPPSWGHSTCSPENASWCIDLPRIQTVMPSV